MEGGHLDHVIEASTGCGQYGGETFECLVELRRWIIRTRPIGVGADHATDVQGVTHPHRRSEMQLLVLELRTGRDNRNSISHVKP